VNKATFYTGLVKILGENWILFLLGVLAPTIVIVVIAELIVLPELTNIINNLFGKIGPLSL
jgi:hypothetical protein